MNVVKNEIYEYVYKLAEEAGVDEKLLTDEIDLFEIGVLDSLNTIRLLSALEKSFKVQFDPEELIPQNLSTIKGIVSLMKRGQIDG